ncbi:MAG: MFS transporter [Acuticoccus sp.]
MTARSDPPPAAPPTHGRWLIVAALALITLINYFDRAAIAFAVPDLRREFGFDAATMGWILGAFGLGYLVSNPICGHLMDRFGVRRVLTVTILLWAVFMGMMAATSTLLGMLVARFCLGLGEGGSFPAMSGVMRGWLAPRERAVGLGLTVAAVPLSSAIGAPLITALIEGYGWRAAFWMLAGATLVWAAIWWFLYRDDPARSRLVNAAELAHIRPDGVPVPAGAGGGDTGAGAWRVVLTNRTAVTNYASAFVAGFNLFFFIGWLPDTLKTVYGLTLPQIGTFAACAWGLATILCVAGGYLSDRIAAAGRRLRVARSLTIAVWLLLAGLVLLPVGFGPPSAVAFVLIAAGMAFTMAAIPPQIASNLDVVPAFAALAHGVYAAAIALAGFLAPVVAGYLAKATGSLAATFVLMGALGILGAAIVVLFHHPDRDRAPAPTP